MGQVIDLDGCAIPCVHPDTVLLARDTAPDPDQVARVSAIFKLLGDPTRTRLLYALLEAGEMCVCDLAAATDTLETTVSSPCGCCAPPPWSPADARAATSTTAS